MARQFLSGSPLSLWSPEKGGFVGCRVWKGGGAGVGKCFHVCMSASHSTSQLAADAFQLPPRKSNRGENTGKWQKERDGHSYSHCHTASWPNPKSKFTFVTSYVGQHTIWARPLSNRRLLRRSSANVLAPCFCVCANYGSLYPPLFLFPGKGREKPCEGVANADCTQMAAIAIGFLCGNKRCPISREIHCESPNATAVVLNLMGLFNHIYFYYWILWNLKVSSFSFKSVV